MTAPSVERPSRRRTARTVPETVEALDPPAVRALLQGAVEEAARLLDADGAFLYRLDNRAGSSASHTTPASGTSASGHGCAGWS